MGDASLLFDDTLELCDPDGSVSSESYWLEALAEGASWGDTQPIEVAINSLIRDGAIVEATSDENREATFVIKVRGTDSASVDAGVQALHLATRKRTTLVWTPPDGYCEPRAWDVETSNLLEADGFDDMAYLRNEQVFRLRLVCLPYRRSLDKVIDDAGTPPSSGTVVNSCESTTGWAYSGAGTPTYTPEYVVDSSIFTEGTGSIRSRATTFQNYSNSTSRAETHDRLSGLSIATGTGGYLSVAIRGQYDTSLHALYMTTASGGRQEITNVIAVGRDANGFVRYAWLVDGGLTVTALEFWVVQIGPTLSTPVVYTWYDDVELATAATTGHQIVKQHQVQGSARTTGSLRIAAPSDSVALDHVLAITVPTAEIPDGFQPDGRRWITQGTTTTDATALSGSYLTPDATAYSTATGKPIFDVPVAILNPGPYTIVGLVKAESSSLTFGVQARLRIGSSDVGPTSAAETSPTGLTTGWQFVVVGTVYLPPLPVQNADSTTKVRLLFKGAKMAEVYMIPAWQVGGRSVADFSIIDCGSGTVGAGAASSNLWIDSPSTDQPQGGWWRGPTSDRANAQSAWPDAKKPGIHVFPPGSLTHFLTSTGAAGPTSTLEYYPRWL